MQIIISILLILLGAIFGVLFMCLVQIGAQADKRMGGVKRSDVTDPEAMKGGE